MINANELRIGNWVNYDTDTRPVMVNGISGDVLVAGIWRDVKQLLPVDLTPEILEKAGFVKNGDIYDMENCSADLCFKLTDGVLIPNPYYTGQSMTKEAWPKHLHQLQNLYFALTGEELNIQL